MKHHPVMGVEAQQKYIEKWADLHSYQVGRFIIEKRLPASGVNPHRRIWRRAMREAAMSGDPLVVSSITRVVDSMMDFVETLNNLQKRDIRLIALEESIDTATEESKMLTSMALMTQRVTDKLAVEFRAEMKAKLMNKKMGGAAGQLLYEETVRDKKGDNSWDLRLIDLILFMYHEKNLTEDQIARKLGSLRLKSPKDKIFVPWSAKKVTDVLLRTSEGRVEKAGLSSLSSQAYKATRDTGPCSLFIPISGEQYNQLLKKLITFESLTQPCFRTINSKTKESEGEAGSLPT